MAVSDITGGRKIPLFVLQLLGLVCVLVAAWMIRDGWYALGVFGLAVLTWVEFIHRHD